jgi:hypothetical protein
MQTPQLYARKAVRTSVNVDVDEAGCTIAGKRSCLNSAMWQALAQPVAGCGSQMEQAGHNHVKNVAAMPWQH